MRKTRPTDLKLRQDPFVWLAVLVLVVAVAAGVYIDKTTTSPRHHPAHSAPNKCIAVASGKSPACAETRRELARLRTVVAVGEGDGRRN